MLVIAIQMPRSDPGFFVWGKRTKVRAPFEGGFFVVGPVNLLGGGVLGCVHGARTDDIDDLGNGEVSHTGGAQASVYA